MSADTLVFMLLSSALFVIIGLVWIAWRDRNERAMRKAEKWDRIPLP